MSEIKYVDNLSLYDDETILRGVGKNEMRFDRIEDVRSLFECSDIDQDFNVISSPPSSSSSTIRTKFRDMPVNENEYIATRRKELNLPSLSVLVFKQGKIVARGVDGAERDSRYHLGSCTKAMTAMLCARFKEKGRLSFDDPITKYFKTSNSSLWYDVTIRHLMCHESGLDQTINSKAVWSYMWRETNRKDQRPIRKHVCETLLNTVDPSKGKNTYVVCDVALSCFNYV